jgi:cell division protein FtsZ
VSSNEEVTKEVSQEQTILTFDLPISAAKEEQSSTEEKSTFEIDDKVKDMPVKDYIELITVTEANEKGETRYALDDYIVLESAINQDVKQKELAEETGKDIVFEKKVLEEKEEDRPEVEELDPINSPISEFLKERASERRQKMKDFNYKFNNSKIDEIEKEPAYKRKGVNLEDAQHSSDTNTSRLSLGLDENDDIQLRSNNSFLHDNVD